MDNYNNNDYRSCDGYYSNFNSGGYNYMNNDYYPNNSLHEPLRVNPNSMENMYYGGTSNKNDTPVVSLVGFILSLVGILILPILFEPAALVCTIIGQKKKSSKLGKAGLIISIICTSLVLIVIMLYVIYYIYLIHEYGG